MEDPQKKEKEACGTKEAKSRPWKRKDHVSRRKKKKKKKERENRNEGRKVAKQEGNKEEQSC